MIITTYDFVGGGGGQLNIAYANTQHSVTLVPNLYAFTYKKGC